MKTRFQIILLLVVTSFGTNATAQEVSIPDSGLDAAIRATLVKPAGPLTVQDMLSLTNLMAGSRGVKKSGRARNCAQSDHAESRLQSTDRCFLSERAHGPDHA